MNRIDVKTLVLGMVQTNCYIISNPQNKEAIVIDPAADADKINQYLKSNDLVCKGILLTHGHFDHIMAGDELRELTGVKIYAHEKELRMLRDPKLNVSTFTGREYQLEPDVLLKDGQNLELAGLRVKVIHTPGHTGGGVCYHIILRQEDYLRQEDSSPESIEEGDIEVQQPAVLISGDTLFYEDIGRSDLPTGNHRQLVESIVNQLMILEEDLNVYPGHGNPTTIGHERDYNPYLSTEHFYES